MKKETVICGSCAGQFDKELPKCPYCGTLNYYGAEKEYLKKLDDVKSDVSDLSNVPRKETIREFKTQAKKFKKILLAVSLVAIAIIGIVMIKTWLDLSAEKRSYLWQKENFPKMNELYDSGQFDELEAYYLDASDRDCEVWSWKHNDFYEYYRAYMFLNDEFEDEKNGITLYAEDYKEIFFRELNLWGAEYNELLSDDERDNLAPCIAIAQEDFHKRFNISEEELAPFIEHLETYNYANYNDCVKYVEKWMKDTGKE